MIMEVRWGDQCSRFEDAAGWCDRLSTVAAAPADRGDLSAALIRPDGLVAWAAASGPSADTAARATALRTWIGEPRTCMANGQKGEPAQPEGRKSTGQRIGKV
ncbi:aromatic-ring hydroxylase C-terminal domain-containing protein [Streptomyces sp. NPDC002004]